MHDDFKLSFIHDIINEFRQLVNHEILKTDLVF